MRERQESCLLPADRDHIFHVGVLTSQATLGFSIHHRFRFQQEWGSSAPGCSGEKFRIWFFSSSQSRLMNSKSCLNVSLVILSSLSMICGLLFSTIRSSIMSRLFSLDTSVACQQYHSRNLHKSMNSGFKRFCVVFWQMHVVSAR